MPKLPKITILQNFALSQDWLTVLIKLCHGNNFIHMLVKVYQKSLFSFEK